MLASHRYSNLIFSIHKVLSSSPNMFLRIRAMHDLIFVPRLELIIVPFFIIDILRQQTDILCY